MTQSELLFESILTNNDIAYKKIPEKSSRTPDYQVYLNNDVTYWEIKELTKNPEEQHIQALIDQDKHDIYTINSLRVTNCIKSACGQFKEFGATNHPCVIVLYDAREFSVKDFTLYQYIQSAMLGIPEYRINNDGKKVEINRSHGLLTNRKRYISAIAIMTDNKHGLHFFHNPNAEESLKRNPILLQFKNHFFAFKESTGIVWRKL